MVHALQSQAFCPEYLIMKWESWPEFFSRPEVNEHSTACYDITRSVAITVLVLSAREHGQSKCD